MVRGNYAPFAHPRPRSQNNYCACRMICDVRDGSEGGWSGVSEAGRWWQEGVTGREKMVGGEGGGGRSRCFAER